MSIEIVTRSPSDRNTRRLRALHTIWTVENCDLCRVGQCVDCGTTGAVHLVSRYSGGYGYDARAECHAQDHCRAIVRARRGW